MRTLMRRILERGGFTVVGEADTGNAAIAEYDRLRPDVVTMDIVMKDMGGLEAVREIRKHDPSARILMCSAMSPPQLVEEAMAAGASEFVVKPFQPNTLLEAMQRVLG
jgi:two-component system chemotaxis response regulator CheY